MRKGRSRCALSVRQFQRLKRRLCGRGGGRAADTGCGGRPSPRRLAPAAARPRGGVAARALRRVERLPRDREAAGGGGPARSAAAQCAGCAAPWASPPNGAGGRARGGMRRTPEAQMGALVQLDASPFRVAGRRAGPRLALHGAIDDATGHRAGPRLPPHRGPARLRHGVRSSCARRYGRPLALVRRPLRGLRPQRSALDPWPNNCAARQDPTHFGRMLQDLGIGFIAAHSPQAKGRIERFWQTLQDRLVSELHLRGHRPRMEAANAFLPGLPRRSHARASRGPPADAPGGLAGGAARSGGHA